MRPTGIETVFDVPIARPHRAFKLANARLDCGRTQRETGATQGVLASRIFCAIQDARKFRKAFLLFIGLALFSLPATAQNFTNVTGTITDPNGLPYSNSTITANLIGGNPSPVNGQAIQGSITAPVDVNGTFSMAVASNTVVGGQWRFTVNTAGAPPPLGTGPQNFSVTITISGASQSISTQLNAAALALSKTGTGLPAGQIPYGVGGGSAQAQTVTTTPNITSLVTGEFVTWLPIAANTAAAPTLAAGTTAATAITKCGTSALIAGDLLTTIWAVAQYDGTEWVLQNPVQAQCNGGLPTSGGTANAQTLTLNPALTAYTAGLTFQFLPSAANTGAATLAISGLAVRNITKCGTTALIANDLTTTAAAILLDDGTELQLLNPQASTCPGVPIVQVPATTTANTIAPTANSVVSLTVIGTTGTAVDILDVEGTSGNKDLWEDSGRVIRLGRSNAACETVTNAQVNMVCSQNIATSLTIGNVLAISATLPTIAAAGCGGTNSTISAANGTASFEILVGSGGATSGGCTITMPAATTSWTCDANTVGATTTTNYLVKQTGAISTTSVTIQNFSDAAVATAFAASETIRVKCLAN